MWEHNSHSKHLCLASGPHLTHWLQSLFAWPQRHPALVVVPSGRVWEAVFPLPQELEWHFIGMQQWNAIPFDGRAIKTTSKTSMITCFAKHDLATLSRYQHGPEPRNISKFLFYFLFGSPQDERFPKFFPMNLIFFQILAMCYFIWNIHSPYKILLICSKSGKSYVLGRTRFYSKDFEWGLIFFFFN